jgi:hypothetical protein
MNKNASKKNNKHAFMLKASSNVVKMKALNRCGNLSGNPKFIH